MQAQPKVQWSCPKCNLTHQGPTTELLAWAQQVGRDRLVRELRHQYGDAIHVDPAGVVTVHGLRWRPDRRT
jgi:hypothetical protein